MTSGGLVLFGTEHGTLYALDARTGRIVWKAAAAGPIGAAPTVYDFDRATYVAVTVGGADSFVYDYPYSGAGFVRVWKLAW